MDFGILMLTQAGVLIIQHFIKNYLYVVGDSDRRGGWSRDGVELVEELSNNISAVCRSYHLTSFAVLVSLHEPEKVQYHLVSNIKLSYPIGNRSSGTYSCIIHWMFYFNSVSCNSHCNTGCINVQVSLYYIEKSLW